MDHETCGEYGFTQYGTRHRFEVGLALDLPIGDQPFGLIGSGIDLTGRMNGRRIGASWPISSTGRPFVLDERLPSITLLAVGFCDVGEDLYIRTLFFAAQEFGLVAETRVIAGRAAEDCCSPEIYFCLYKVRLDDDCPLQPVRQADAAPGAVLGAWETSTNAGLSAPVMANFTSNSEMLQRSLLNQMYGMMLGRKAG